MSGVDKANYFEIEEGDTTASAYTFDNNSNGYFAQLSYRPSMLDNKVLKNFEVVGRYSVLNTPEESEWEQEATQMALGLNYWINWRSVLKLTYQVTNSTGGHDSGGAETKTTGIYAHWALGF